MILLDTDKKITEKQRYVREGFASDEELSLYDMLLREDLSKNDIKKLKEVAATLLQKIKAKISELDHWTDKQETKAAVDNLISDTLWAQLPECYDEVSISVYRQQIYEYVYTRYKEAAQKDLLVRNIMDLSMWQKNMMPHRKKHSIFLLYERSFYMIRVLFVCHGSILENPGKANKINGFARWQGAYHTIFERALM